eukprot:CAMPEP_0119513686 /NCGR_PEP_ID=MMETSP1344-20130328/31727_1 /TAXON_ID=236787 /ORGANISM="Florenciella parvula, Strain CCMP2471" /LENGTH=81 /DNA_ID=CAMNT_0007550925 /DNA_START=122 /DNA_END=367 /DNA_ORIENTATION=+
MIPNATLKYVLHTAAGGHGQNAPLLNAPSPAVPLATSGPAATRTPAALAAAALSKSSFTAASRACASALRRAEHSSLATAT